MNDRGLDLSATDLVKNHLFDNAGDSVAEAERQWATMLGILESVQEADIVKDFVRHYWISRYGGTRTQELFSEIKKRTDSKTNSIEMLARLKESAISYVAILNPMHGFWDGYTDRSRRNIATLGHLGLKQARPLLLAVLERFPKHQIEQVLRLAVSWSVRFLVSGELGSGALESEYGKAALQVTEGKIKTVDQLGVAMSGIVPADDAFRSTFSTLQTPRAAIARYYLRALELQASDAPEPENIPNDDQTILTLEHILPEDVKAGEWPEFNNEQRLLYTSRLGNMALLRKSLNSDAKSLPFADKKSFYKASDLILTSTLASLDEWTPASVLKRQQALSDIAVKTWPIKNVD